LIKALLRKEEFMKLDVKWTHARFLIFGLTLIILVCPSLLGQIPGPFSDKLLALEEPRLTVINVRFETRDDDKDHDTIVFLSLRKGNGEIVAKSEPIYGHFPNDQTTGPYPLKPLKNVYRRDILSCSLSIRIEPKGHDTWRFVPKIELVYSPGQVVLKDFEYTVLSESSRERSFGLE
jgi:hypothetical protein